ncbi:hypothetical protein B0H14DRAFT_2647695 [Mycena olivaceomarginata]|nr:hypothetical protein B0H14DRAFT_2647695 [Mycena olivaceomarginata]
MGGIPAPSQPSVQRSTAARRPFRVNRSTRHLGDNYQKEKQNLYLHLAHLKCITSSAPSPSCTPCPLQAANARTRTVHNPHAALYGTPAWIKRGQCRSIMEFGQGRTPAAGHAVCVSQLRAVRSLAVSGKASAACAGASIYGIGRGRPPATGGRSGARSCRITGVGSMRRRGATRQEGEGGGLEALPTHRVQHGLGTPSRRRNCEQAVPGCAEPRSGRADPGGGRSVARGGYGAGEATVQMVCENQSRKTYQRIGFKVNKGPAARPKGQLKALFLSWKSSVEFSRREVIQEQWDVDVGGGPATPDLERRQHQTAETVYFGRTTGYLLNNDPKKSIKGEINHSLPGFIRRLLFFTQNHLVWGFARHRRVEYRAGCPRSEEKCRMNMKQSKDLGYLRHRSSNLQSIEKMDHRLTTGSIISVVLTGGSDQLEIQAAPASKIIANPCISTQTHVLILLASCPVARPPWPWCERGVGMLSVDEHAYIARSSEGCCGAAGVVHVGRAQKQAGWMRVRGGVPASTIGAQVHGAEDRRKQVACTEGGEHADKLVVQKRRSGAGGVRGGSTIHGAQCGVGGTTGERMVCGADCAVVCSCEQARGSWASRRAWQERIVLEHERAYAKRSSASTPCTYDGRGAGLGAILDASLSTAKAGAPRGKLARRALGAGALLGVGNAEHRKSGSAAGQAGTMRADEAPRACGRPGQTSARGGSTIGRAGCTEQPGAAAEHPQGTRGQRVSKRGGCERRRAGVLRRDLLYVDHSMSFGVDGTASDRKHIPAGCMNRPERTKSKKKKRLKGKPRCGAIKRKRRCALWKN